MKNFLLASAFCLVCLFVGCGSKDVSVSNYFDSNKIYKIIPSQNYDPDNEMDAVNLLPLDLESGFIHASFGNQVEKILKKFFVGQSNILILELDQNILAEHGLNVQKEQNNPNGDYFPHIYGRQQIPALAIISVFKVEEKDDGSWVVVN